MSRGLRHNINFEINEHVYFCYYLLGDGIYPPMACFGQPIHEPLGEMKQHFAKCQEGASKDALRAFEVLQAKRKIIKNLV